jgi:hypothetical protein
LTVRVADGLGSSAAAKPANTNRDAAKDARTILRIDLIVFIANSPIV